MMIKVANEFLDFNDLIEVEKQIKLFEEISTTDGDFSYAFDLAKTLNNTRILQNPQPDNISKLVYQKIPAKLLSDGGVETFDGYLRIERITEVYHCSFFAGNNNWFGMLSDSLQTLDWSEYDVNLTETNLSFAIFKTSGVVFPMVDNGQLLKRGYQLMKVEDFVGAIYVKDVFKKVFSSHGIKIQGDFLEDYNYQNAITLSNPKNEEFINSKSAYIGKTIPQTISSGPGIPTRDPVQITWDTDSSAPFFNNGHFDLSIESYTADVKMIMKIELFLSCQQSPSDPMRFYTEVRVNGAVVGDVFTNNPVGDLFTVNLVKTIDLEAGDVVDFSINKSILEGDPFDILNATVKLTPTYVYRAIGSSVVPSWTQQQYVSNVLRNFNVLASYKEATKTLTLNLFDKIKSKLPLDLSEYISEVEVDYTEFISEYGKKSLLSYQETEDEDIITNFFKYSKGSIDVDNDFLADSEDILVSDFAQPIGYINNVFDMSIEKTDFIELDEDITVNVTAVTDATDDARFAVEEDEFELSDLVRVTDSTNPNYNGDYMVVSFGAGWIELSGVKFDTDARAKITKLNYTYSDSDNVYLLINVPLYAVNKFSGLNSFIVENTDYEHLSLGFFNILNTGRQVNRDFINSLSFSGEDNPLHYQNTMIEQYFRLFSRVLNDPVKLICTAHLPYHVYNQIDFLRPITIKTMESSNQYYLNRISGYRESFLSCVIELIKL